MIGEKGISLVYFHTSLEQNAVTNVLKIVFGIIPGIIQNRKLLRSLGFELSYHPPAPHLRVHFIFFHSITFSFLMKKITNFR